MKTFRTLAAACAISVLAFGIPPSQAQPAQAGKTPATVPNYVPQSGQPGKDVVWVPTQDALVQRMLDMAGATVGQGDVGRPRLTSDELDAGTLSGPQVSGE